MDRRRREGLHAPGRATGNGAAEIEPARRDAAPPIKACQCTNLGHSRVTMLGQRRLRQAGTQPGQMHMKAVAKGKN